MCTYASVWQVIPPIIPWSYISVIWFLLISFIQYFWNIALPFIPHIVISIILVSIGIVLGIYMIGPLTILPFGIFSFLSWIQINFKYNKNYTKSLLFAINTISIIAVIVGTSFGVKESIKATKMTTTDVIMMWDGTALSRELLIKLQKQEPASISEYRKLLKQWDGSDSYYYPFFVFERLAIIGSPKEDVPLMLGALELTYKYKNNDYTYSHFETALKKITGLNLPENTPASKCREEWAKQP